MIALPMLRDPIMVGAKGEESIPGRRQQDECISTVLSKDKRLKTSDAPLLAHKAMDAFCFYRFRLYIG
jgi:hypothetical protein